MSPWPVKRTVCCSSSRTVTSPQPAGESSVQVTWIAAVGRATAPFSGAVTTSAGCRSSRALTELPPRLPLTSRAVIRTTTFAGDASDASEGCARQCPLGTSNVIGADTPPICAVTSASENAEVIAASTETTVSTRPPAPGVTIWTSMLPRAMAGTSGEGGPSATAPTPVTT